VRQYRSIVVICSLTIALIILLVGYKLLSTRVIAPDSPGRAVQPRPTGTMPRPTPTARDAHDPVYPWRSHSLNPYLPGDVLIADANNSRIILVTPDKRIVWQFPLAETRPNRPFSRPDDAFFGPHFDEVITNEEYAETISIIGFAQKKVVWQYGHYGIPGSAPGYLRAPDDAFLYDKNGGIITAADIQNQRIISISRQLQRIIEQYGKVGVRVAKPPALWAAPNGAFPAPNGGLLITQIGGQNAALLNRQGQVVWQVKFPFPYPSDANFTPDGNIICAFYDRPGAVVKMTPQGRLLWEYHVTAGPGMLNHPSLAVQLPNGSVLLNDDYNHRVIVIDPRTNRIVWQYGHTGVPGSAADYLNNPDGLDFLPAGVIPGANNPIGRHLWSYPGNGY
jgi:hypothetical protein